MSTAKTKRERLMTTGYKEKQSNKLIDLLDDINRRKNPSYASFYVEISQGKDRMQYNRSMVTEDTEKKIEEATKKKNSFYDI